MESASPKKKTVYSSEKAESRQKQNKKQTPKPPKKITERYLYNAGLHYLKRYTASSSHFRNVMMRKVRKSCRHHIDQDLEKCKETLDKIIEKLTEEGFLNDPQYTYGMTASYRKRGVSKKYIETKLRQKGLPAELIAETIDAIDTHNHTEHENPEIAAALIHARKKRLGPYSKTTAPQTDKDLQRALGSFARAGFSYEIARHVLDLPASEAS